MLLHLLRKHFGILSGRQRHEWRAETGRESRLWLCDPNFSPCHLGGVPGKEVVHRLSRVQSADRRQHTERVAGQKEDVLGMGARPVSRRARNVRDWIRDPGVLRNGSIEVIRCHSVLLETDVFEHRAKLDRIVNLRFAVRIEVDGLGVTAAFHVEHTVFAPSVFIVPDERTVHIA